MSYNKYINNTGTTRQYLLPSELGDRVTGITLIAGGTITIGYPGLDSYVPACLAKITENGEDLSHKVVRSREAVLVVQEIAKEIVKTPVEEVVEEVPEVDVSAIVEEVPEVAEEATEEKVVEEALIEEVKPVKPAKKAKK